MRVAGRPDGQLATSILQGSRFHVQGGVEIVDEQDRIRRVGFPGSSSTHIGEVEADVGMGPLLVEPGEARDLAQLRPELDERRRGERAGGVDDDGDRLDALEWMEGRKGPSMKRRFGTLQQKLTASVM